MEDAGNSPASSQQLKAFVMKKPLLRVIATLFGLFSAFHVWATLTALNRLVSEPGLVAGRAAIAIASGCLAFFAWRWSRSSGRAA